MESYITKEQADEYFIKSEIDSEINETRNTLEVECLRRYPCTKLSTAVFIYLKYICSQRVALIAKGINPNLIKQSELSSLFNHKTH